MASLFARDDGACGLTKLLRINGGRRNKRCNWTMVNHMQWKLFLSFLIAAALFSWISGVNGQDEPAPSPSVDEPSPPPPNDEPSPPPPEDEPSPPPPVDEPPPPPPEDEPSPPPPNDEPPPPPPEDEPSPPPPVDEPPPSPPNDEPTPPSLGDMPPPPPPDYEHPPPPPAGLSPLDAETPHPPGGKKVTGIVVGAIVGGIAVIALIGGGVLWKCKKKPQAEKDEQPDKSAFGDKEPARPSQGDHRAYTMEAQNAPKNAANGATRRNTRSAANESISQASQMGGTIGSDERTGLAPSISLSQTAGTIASDRRAGQAPSIAPVDMAGTVAADRGTGWVPSNAQPFTYNEIRSITQDFSKDIGHGGSATVYLGQISKGNRTIAVAVKKMKESCSDKLREQLLKEVNIMMRTHHRNLVSLIGLCMEGNEIILVCEYMARGSLFDILQARTSELTWRKRLQIAVDVATGLEYLHTGCKPAIIHRDVKARNILLNENLEAKLADFGLSKGGAADGSECAVYHTEVAGTCGYLDPLYAGTGELTNENDVYSFGVVLFELITGKPAIVEFEPNKRCNLTNWVMPMLTRGDMESLLDPMMKGNCNIQSVWEVAGLARSATQDPKGRPDMTEMLKMLKEALRMEISWADVALSSETSISQSFQAVRCGPGPR